MKFMNIFRVNIFCFLFFTFFYISSFAQNIDELSFFTKKDLIIKKDTITFFYSQSSKNQTKKPTIIFLQGSLPIPVILENNGKKDVAFPFDYTKLIDSVNLVIIKRKGTLLSASYDSLPNIKLNPSKEYIKHNNLYYRVKQAQLVLNYLGKQKWVNKKKIFMVGHSEGYRVAAYLSKNNNNKIAKLVCMSADPFSRSSEEVTRFELENLSSDNDSININEIKNIIENNKNIGNVANYKNDYELFNWASYEVNMPISSFDKFKNPLLIVYGSNDEKSFNNHLVPFLIKKKNLELKMYPNMDHNFFTKEFDKTITITGDNYHWDKVFSDVVNWLLDE
jgi:dienelactone hydrolase